MTSRLLVILAHSGASEALKRHWEFWRRADMPILGVDREDTKTEWPHNPDLGRISVGKESYVSGTNHLDRFLNVIYHCVVNTKADEFNILEFDCVTFRPPPPMRGPIEAHLAGYGSDGFLGTKYYHCPWRLTREGAKDVYARGKSMLNNGEIEKGFIDRWLGYMADLYNMPITPTTGTYSRNTIDRPEYVEEARQAIRDQAWAIHGVKSEPQLRNITEDLTIP